MIRRTSRIIGERESWMLSSFNNDNQPATGYLTGQSLSLCCSALRECVFLRRIFFSRLSRRPQLCMVLFHALPGWEPPTPTVYLIPLSAHRRPVRYWLENVGSAGARWKFKKTTEWEFAFSLSTSAASLLCGGEVVFFFFFFLIK